MTFHRYAIRRVFIFLLVFVSLQLLFSQAEKGNDVISRDELQRRIGFFEITESFHCTMKFDIKTFQKFKLKGNYMPARLTYYDRDSILTEQKFRVKARGNFRRQHCSMPPFWLNIKKSHVKAEDFEGIEKVKIVTHCMGGNAYNKYILKEYLAYKIFNIITPYSFRVRLLKIKYIDTGRNNKESTNWGFVIEPEETLARRLESIKLENDALSLYYTDTLATDVMSLYQYMIGHTDFSVAGRHNLKLIKSLDPFKYYPYPIPYDLDYAGIVNAYYAKPKNNVPIEKVTERYFQGPCRTREQYAEALNIILEKEEEILELISNFSYLDEKDRSEMLEYIKSFYEEARSPRFLNSISSSCISPPSSN